MFQYLYLTSYMLHDATYDKLHAFLRNPATHILLNMFNK